MSKNDEIGESIADGLTIGPRQAGRHPVLADARQTLGQSGLAVGGYVRVSTAKEGQRSSIANQEKYLREWCDVHGYRLHRMYLDVKSGEFARLRSELQQMLTDISEKRITGVVTKEIARSSRDVMDTLELKRRLHDQGAFLVSIRENYDSRTDDDEFLLILHAALAQKERKTTGARVKVTQLLKAREGRGNVPPPYGYRYGHDGRYVPDPAEAKVYRQIVDLFLGSRYGRTRIARFLNTHGIPGPRGGTWITSTIKVILENPVYLGFLIYNTTTLIRTAGGERKRMVRPREEWIVVPDAHPPLITRDDFDLIQEIMRQRRERDPRATCSFAPKYLLSGFLLCSVCGGKMYGTVIRGKQRECRIYRYVCQGKNGRCSLPMKYYKMDTVDQHVFSEVARTLQALVEPAALADFVQQRRDSFAGGMQKEREERARLQGQIAANEKAQRRQQIAYETEAIDLHAFKRRLDELRWEERNLRERLKAFNRKLSRIDQEQEVIAALVRKMANYLEHPEQLGLARKRSLLELAVERIEAHGEHACKITWTFPDS
ncbi:recombinase family protein [Heliobacterium undosum]|uniref:Recombinase family protein n=1 Tax=Heliomicrobium undosum TaxID=121734 RepID=A0A845KZU5_9FIRM|nr:recombinase family protein [Heliomicrobium undosum]MZP29363.1 recombinase family protein [Heliomicrobium undosum]